MAGKRIVVPNYMPALDLTGAPVAGAKLYFYENGTTTLKSIYTTSALNVAHPNPVAASAAGVFPSIFADEAEQFSVAITDAANAPISGLRNRDNVRPSLVFGQEATESAEDTVFTPEGVDAVPRSLQDKARERVSPFDFGAVGDGVADDTDAFLAAIAELRTGGTLWLGDGFSFLLSESLIIEKPINIRGGSKENTKLLFASSGTYVETGEDEKVGLWFLHSSTVATGYSGDARRSVLSGFTVRPKTTSPADMIGVVISVPVYVYEVDAVDFSLDGFAVLASISGDADALAGVPIGNANGTAFRNCIGQDNGRHGFHLVGDNANSCTLSGCRGPSNGAWGFYDNSLLGNTYLGCEADSNTTGGYFASSAKPNRSTYIGCYSETAGHFSLGPLCVNINPQGLYKPNTASGGVTFSGLPVGPAYSTRPIRIASTDDIANSNGDSPNAGKCIEIGPDGIDFRGDPAGLHVKLTGLNSANYTDLMNGSNYMLRMAKAAIAGNLNASTPWMPGGFVLGGNVRSGIVGAGAAAPTTGSYDIGAIWLNESPTAGGKVGWVCVTAGAPGTWKPFGAIDA